MGARRSRRGRKGPSAIQRGRSATGGLSIPGRRVRTQGKKGSNEKGAKAGPGQRGQINGELDPSIGQELGQAVVMVVGGRVVVMRVRVRVKCPLQGCGGASVNVGGPLAAMLHPAMQHRAEADRAGERHAQCDVRGQDLAPGFHGRMGGMWFQSVPPCWQAWRAPSVVIRVNYDCSAHLDARSRPRTVLK